MPPEIRSELLTPLRKWCIPLEVAPQKCTLKGDAPLSNWGNQFTSDDWWSTCCALNWSKVDQFTDWSTLERKNPADMPQTSSPQHGGHVVREREKNTRGRESESRSGGCMGVSIRNSHAFLSRWGCRVREGRGLRTGSWTGPSKGKRAPRV